MTFLPATSPVVYILHENSEWMPPLLAGFDAEGVPFREWKLDAGSIDLTQAPPEGVFWSRLSASSHTRGHAHAKEYARSVLRWLEAHGRRVVNGTPVVELEVSKVAQYVELSRAGFDVPVTIAVFGIDDLRARARELALPFITKHNQGGKGLGVRRFDSYADFDAYLAGPDFEVPVDGITLLQEYVMSAEPFITRAEFVGGRFVYAVRVDTSAGSFELCPADSCAVDPVPELVPQLVPGLAPAVCAVPSPGTSLFTRRDDIEAGHPLIERLGAFLAAHRIEVAGVEFIETADGRLVTYDVNTNTNYNPDVEAGLPAAGGARSVARFLGRELRAAYPDIPD